jgi:hypothetical protein
MKVRPLDCAELRNGFVAGRVPAGPEVDAHSKECPLCRELMQEGAHLGRGLAEAAGPQVEPGDLFAQVELDVKREVGLRAALRALPSRVRAGALLVVALALLGLGLGFLRRGDFAGFSPWVFWAVVAVLIFALAVGVGRLVRSATLPLGAASREGRRAAAFLVLPAAALLFVPLGSGAPDAAEWGEPLGCLFFGATLVTPFLLLYWLFERRDTVPVSSLVSAGALAGIAANLLLHAHCASAHLGHLLLGHASIGAALSLALGVLSRSLRAAR